MYTELYQYILLHKRLAVPGIGTFLLERRPADNDFLERQIKAPVYSINFSSQPEPASKKFFYKLSKLLAISDRDAVIRFNDFVFDMKKQISSGASINWNGMGVLSKGLGGDMKFIPEELKIVEQPVSAEKVIRENAEHMVRVGEDRKTSVEMTEMLHKTVTARSYWWVYALAIGVLAFIFIAWHLSEHGVDISSTANTAKLIPMETPAP